MNEVIRRLRHRLAGIIQRVTVSRVNSGTKAQTLQIRGPAGEPVDDVQQFEGYGLTSHPAPGSTTEALVLHVGGNPDHPIAIVAGDRQWRITGLAAGEVCLYDDLGSRVQLKRGELLVSTTASGLPIKVASGGAVDVDAAGDVTVDATGSVNVTGATGVDVTGTTGDVTLGATAGKATATGGTGAEVNATTGDAKIQAVAGKVVINGLVGGVEVNSGNGNVAINVATANVAIAVASGNISAETASGDVSIKTLNGNASLLAVGGNTTLGDPTNPAQVMVVGPQGPQASGTITGSL